MVARNDDVEDSDVVVWNVFGLTHNPRVEDWPVMPVEIHQVHLRPADFFERNPALDVPSNKNIASVEVGRENGDCCHSNGNGAVQQDPAAHLQGTANGIPVATVNGTNGVNGH
jgi:primary-amine oxidase